MFIPLGSMADNGNHKDVVEVETIQELREAEDDGETVYELTGEAILTYQQGWRNQRYIQDETAGIMIDDDDGIITTDYDIYDGITGITGILSTFGNMLQFVPEEDPGEATSSDNEVEPVVITMDDFVNNFMDYQARLVTIEEVYFVDADQTFSNGTEYDISDGETEATFRTTFYDVDYIGDPVPAGDLNMTGLPNSRSEGDFISSRNWNDIEPLDAYDVTFNVVDEDNNEIDDAQLEFYGETIESAPYFFEEIPVGTYDYTLSKEGYHTTHGQVTVADSDLTHTAVLVEIDPDMVTEFPFEETFDGEEFPPENWSHYSLGEGGWELDDGSAYHDDTAEGEQANSWLITPQIQLPDDENMLFTFFENNQFMTEYGYSGVMISTGSGNPEHEHFQELYESDDGDIGVEDPAETLLSLGDFTGEVVYLAFNYQGELAHRWWIHEVMLDFAPGAIEVPDIATLREQEMGDLPYIITGEVFITHQQLGYRGQFYIQDETAAIVVDDPDGIVESEYDLYDGITGLTGHLSEFFNLMQIGPTEDPGEATSQDNEIEPVEMTLADLTPEHQAQLVVVRNVHFDHDEIEEETFEDNTGYAIYDDTAESQVYIPNDPNAVDYIGEPVPETPKDLIAVVGQFQAEMQILPRMLDDFMEPTTSVSEIDPLDLRIYPNPATDYVTVVSSDAHLDHVRIYNMHGQLVIEQSGQELGRTQLDVASLSPGMYVIEISSGDKISTQKLQIQ